MELDWPNAAAPGLARFRVDVPPDWTAAEAGGALLVLTGPEQDGFRANVVVTGDRVPDAVGVAAVADDVLAGYGDELVRGDAHDRPADGPALPIAVRRGCVRAGDHAVDQIVVATEAGDRSPAGLRSVFVLTGTFLADRLAEDEPVVTGLISSFTVRDG